MDAAHAVELAELLTFLGQWIDDAPDQVARWFVRFTYYGSTLDALRADLDRFALLLAVPDVSDPDIDISRRLLAGPPTNRNRSATP